MSEAELKRDLYYRALRQMNKENPIWRKNLQIWLSWDDDWRDWWIRRIERQAEEQLPMAVELVSTVIAIRMKG